jgi:ABC-type bacteriocin/lantibiotic exporter with double-glycine peptidase domain
MFGMRWFLPTLWRYRRPLGHVLAASLFVQIFALATPLIFQVIVDKLLTHKGYEMQRGVEQADHHQTRDHHVQGCANRR